MIPQRVKEVVYGGWASRAGDAKLVRMILVLRVLKPITHAIP